MCKMVGSILGNDDEITTTRLPDMRYFFGQQLTNAASITIKCTVLVLHVIFAILTAIIIIDL